MAQNERGMQSKQDNNSRLAIDNGDFPILCEGCLGDTPYVRMQKLTLAGECKMCDRPFTVFKWRPGRGEGYRKTEVCQVCSKVKNLCQTCILDLQFGLPSQLRDAVLANEGTMALPESDVNREYHAQQQLTLLASGQDPWQSENTPNEQLLRIARTAALNRESDRLKMPPQGVKRARSEADEFENEPKEGAREYAGKNIVSNLPPGIENVSELSTVNAKGFKPFVPPEHLAAMTFMPSSVFAGHRPGFYFSMGSSGLGYYVDPKQPHRSAPSSESLKKAIDDVNGSSGTVKKHGPPKGPPPVWALTGSSKPPQQS